MRPRSSIGSGSRWKSGYRKRDYDELSRLDAHILDRRINLFIGAARR